MANLSEELKDIVVIGITGPAASGKGTLRDLLLEYLSSRNIDTHFFSMSDEVRREALKINPQYTRADLREVSMGLKKQFGVGVLALRALHNVEQLIASGSSPKIMVTEAIRNVHEIEEFHRHLTDRFILIAVIAPMDDLVNRIIARQRHDENATMFADRNKVIQMIESEVAEETDYGHQINKCIEKATVVIKNNKTVDDLRTQVDAFFKTNILPLLEKVQY